MDHTQLPQVLKKSKPMKTQYEVHTKGTTNGVTCKEPPDALDYLLDCKCQSNCRKIQTVTFYFSYPNFLKMNIQYM